MNGNAEASRCCRFWQLAVWQLTFSRTGFMADESAQVENQGDAAQAAAGKAPETQLEKSTYEIIQNRLVTHSGELRERLEKLNRKRREVFGSIPTELVATDLEDPIDTTRIGDAEPCRDLARRQAVDEVESQHGDAHAIAAARRRFLGE